MYQVVPSYCIHFIYLLRILAATNSPFPPPAPSSLSALPVCTTIPTEMQPHPTLQDTKREENNQADERNNQTEWEFQTTTTTTDSLEKGNELSATEQAPCGLSFLQPRFMVTYLVDGPF